MKRRFFKLALFLLLGAIVNVAVACACAIWSETTLGSMRTQLTSKADLDHMKVTGWKPKVSFNNWSYTYANHNWQGFGVTDSFVVEEAIRQQGNSGTYNGGVVRENTFIAHKIQSGWPLRCMSGEYVDPSGKGIAIRDKGKLWRPSNYVGSYWLKQYAQCECGTYPTKTWKNTKKIHLPKKIGPITFPVCSHLPLRPIWSGQIINTFFYASILWMIIFISVIAKRYKRFSRGHCPVCNYALHGISEAGCPECGWGREAEA